MASPRGYLIREHILILVTHFISYILLDPYHGDLRKIYAIWLTYNDQLTSKSHTLLAVVVEPGMGRLFRVGGCRMGKVGGSSDGCVMGEMQFG
jgi:hypothetical protein